MKTPNALYRSFNAGLERRRATPRKDGPPDISDTANHGTGVRCGIAELGYQARNGLPLQCHWQGDDDPFWITDELNVLAYHLGYNLLPAIDDLRGGLPDDFIDKEVSAFYKRSLQWIAKAQSAHDLLADKGVVPENAHWFSDDSPLFEIVHEYIRLFKDAEKLDQLPKASHPFRIRPTTVPPCVIP